MSGISKQKKDGAVERRWISGDHQAEWPRVHIRSEEGKGSELRGYGAVFYDGTPATEFELWPGVVERCDPHAFDDAVKKSADVVALFNHSPDNVLGRTSSGTLRLNVDKRGLWYEVDLGDSSTAQDVSAHVGRGDIRGSSIGFIPIKDQWEKRDDGSEVRTILQAELWDVGPVTYPAYQGTTVGVRSEGDLEEARASHDAWERGETEARRAERRATIVRKMGQIEREIRFSDITREMQ